MFPLAEAEALRVPVDLTVYSLPALLRVVHRFTDRCHVHLQREGDAATVQLRAKSPGADLSCLAGDLLNELLDQTLREAVQRETEPVRNLILAHALSNAVLIRPDLETADPLDDPCRIAQPDPVPRRAGEREPLPDPSPRPASAGLAGGDSAPLSSAAVGSAAESAVTARAESARELPEAAGGARRSGGALR